jgi:hypothetical protein
MRILATAVTALMVAVVAACSGSGATSGVKSPPASPSITAEPVQALTVTSTLDGKKVLPHRIVWTARASEPAQVKQVDFLVDGRVAWTELKVPYTYADDDGYLVTTWLKPGRHRFDVRVTAKNGQVATDSIVARVPAPAPVPVSLAGTWQRTVKSTAGAPQPGSAGNPTDTLTPPGTYHLTFDRRWIHDRFPCDSSCAYNANTGAGGEFDTDWVPGARSFRARGSVTFKNNVDTARLDGWWCESNGPAATYTWSVSGRTLTLTPVGGHDACGIRGFVWAGTWTRSGSK